MEAGPSRVPTAPGEKTHVDRAIGNGTRNGSSTPAARPRFTPGESPYHESSQFKHWRYSKAGIAKLRSELNEKSREVTRKNVEAEKEAQASLGQDFKPPPPAAYLSVEDELLLVHFYCEHASKICRSFGLPESAESTSITYIKRFYLKNSVMEWHPKNIMPTCLFLAAKTTNYPVPIDVFVSKLSGFKAADVLDLEFLVAQSLGFEFWVRAADKSLRGWALELQSSPVDNASERVQRALSSALDKLAAARFTDAEFLYTPGQVALAAWRLAERELVDAFLEAKYATTTEGKDGDGDGEEGKGEGEEAVENGTSGASALPFGIELSKLLEIIEQVQDMIGSAQTSFAVDEIKKVDKRLKRCANPAKVPGTALYIKRKSEQEAEAAAAQAAKAAKVAEKRHTDELVFGGEIKPKAE